MSARISIIPMDYLKARGVFDVDRAKLYALQKYDLSFITRNFVYKGIRFSPEQIWPIRAHFGKASWEISKMLELEFKKFVALTLIDRQIIFAPSGPVDMYWHFLILHMKEYYEFCKAIWGCFQHHPRGSRADVSPGISDMRGVALLLHDPSVHEHGGSGFFQKSVAFYEEVFGKPNAQVWCYPDDRMA